MATKLPIDMIQGTVPPQFRWHQILKSPFNEPPHDKLAVNHTGCVSPTMEDALVSLISVARQAIDENNRLSAENKRLMAEIEGYERAEAAYEKASKPSTPPAKAKK